MGNLRGGCSKPFAMDAWLSDFIAAEGLPPDFAEELHEALRTALRNTLKAQRRLVPSADFSSMTAPRAAAGAQGDCT